MKIDVAVIWALKQFSFLTEDLSLLSKLELFAFSARPFLFECSAAGPLVFIFVNVALGEVLSSVTFMIWEVEIFLGRLNSLHLINLASPILYSCHTLMPSIVAVYEMLLMKLRPSHLKGSDLAL